MATSRGRLQACNGEARHLVRQNILSKGFHIPRGDKSSYSSKQKRKAEHIEKSVESRGGSTKTAARIAWATVNKESGGGNKSGSGRGKKENHSASKKGGRKGAASQSHATRVKAGKKAAATRKRKASE